MTDYFLTNNVSGAWISSWFVNEKRWADLPKHLKAVVMASVEASHEYRNQWYWGGEAKLRADGTKLKVETIPADQWREVEDAAARFWDEVAEEGEIEAKVVGIFKEYKRIREAAGGIYNAS